MKLTMLASVSIFALAISATSADAGPAKQQCWAFSVLGQQFDCDHDRSEGDTSDVMHSTPPKHEPPPADDDDDQGDDDDDHCPRDNEPTGY